MLILDNEKEASVLKRLDQLTNIQFVIKINSESKYFDFLDKQIPEIKSLPCYFIDEIREISCSSTLVPIDFKFKHENRAYFNWKKISI